MNQNNLFGAKLKNFLFKVFSFVLVLFSEEEKNAPGKTANLAQGCGTFGATVCSDLVLHKMYPLFFLKS